MGAVHRHLLARNAELEQRMKEMCAEREALNAYVVRVSEKVRTLQRRLRDAGLSDKL